MEGSNGNCKIEKGVACRDIGSSRMVKGVYNVHNVLNEHSTKSTVWSLHGSAEYGGKRGFIEYYSIRDTLKSNEKNSRPKQTTLEFTLSNEMSRATNETSFLASMMPRMTAQPQASLGNRGLARPGDRIGDSSLESPPAVACGKWRYRCSSFLCHVQGARQGIGDQLKRVLERGVERVVDGVETW